MIDTRFRPRIQKFFDWAARPFIAMGFSPTQLTLLAAFLGLGAAGLVLFCGFSCRAAALGAGALSAFFDILDGTVARATGTVSPLGAFLDLILDRIVEACFIMAFAYVFPAAVWPSMVFLTLVIVNFSAFLVAARLFPNMGRKSMHYEGGLVERSETFILFGLMLIFPEAAGVLIWIFNILMALTTAIRLSRIIRFAQKESL